MDESEQKVMDQETGTDPYRDIVVRLAAELDCDRATFFLVDNDAFEVRSKAATLLEIKEIRQSMRRGVVGYVARTGRALNLKDVYNDPRFDRPTYQKTGYRSKSMLTMAIRERDGAVMGVLQALNKRSGVFTPEDEKTMGRYCAEALPLLHAK